MFQQWLRARLRALLTVLLLGSGMTFAIPIVATAQDLSSQIVPDETLEQLERSQIGPEEIIRDLPSQQISGGAERDSNLFHSFEQFSIEVGKGVYFVNPSGIENIFSRITGSNPSNLFGRLGVLGDANLYLMNPNGIIFGRAASLDLRGSFSGTTADSIQFDEQGVFSALSPDIPAQLLTVAPSAYLFNQVEPSGIQSAAQNLAVSPGQNFTLLGGNLTFQNSFIQAPSGGEVDLGSISESGSVRIDNSSRLTSSKLRRRDFERQYRLQD